MTLVQKPHLFKYFLDNAPTPSDTIFPEQAFFLTLPTLDKHLIAINGLLVLKQISLYFNKNQNLLVLDLQLPQGATFSLPSIVRFFPNVPDLTLLVL